MVSDEEAAQILETETRQESSYSSGKTVIETKSIFLHDEFNYKSFRKVEAKKKTIVGNWQIPAMLSVDPSSVTGLRQFKEHFPPNFTAFKHPSQPI